VSDISDYLSMFEVFCVLRPDGHDEELTLEKALTYPWSLAIGVPAGAVDGLVADPIPMHCLANGIPVFLAFECAEDCDEYRRRLGQLHQAGRA
jgi:hypothetical protein